MPRPSISYFVTRDDETAGPGGRDAPIPTFGHIATVFDLYRAAAVSKVRNHPGSWCFTDTHAASALGRIIDGPILSRSDIEKGETALRAILLHDVVDIVVPSVKVRQDNNFVSYVRFDKGVRNQAAFAALNVAPCSDYLLAVELIDVRNGEITGSTNSSSPLIGNALDDQETNYSCLLSAAANVVNALPMQIGAAAHYCADPFTKALKPGPAGFIDELYQRIERPWMEIAQMEPALFIDVKLPPLIAIVLNRAQHREKIPEVLKDLREELAPVREDLKRVNLLLDSSISQADLNAQVRSINESFDAIVPEALLTDAERRRRRITTVFRLAKPIWQIYSLAVNLLAADPDKLIQIVKNIGEAVPQNQKIVARSVTAAKFSELLRVDSARGLVTSHFSPQEISLFSSQ